MEPNKFANFDSFGVGGSFSKQSSFAGNSKSSKDEAKLFIGGLAMVTNESSLNNFFSQFGQVVDCIVMRNDEQRSKGFGFVTLASKDQLEAALCALPHTIDGKIVDSKAAIPRSANRLPGSSGMHDVGSNRLYLVGVTSELTESQISDYFGRFGSVTKVDIVKDRETGTPRGFAFVHFADNSSVEKCLAQPSHNIGNSQCSVRKAVNKENMLSYQQQQSGFVARTPKTRGAFRSQPYPSGRNTGYNNQTYGFPAGGAYPGGAYPHVNPAMQQYPHVNPAMQHYPHVNPAMQHYQTGYSSYAGSPAAGQMWPPSGQPYGMPSSTPVQPMSSWGTGEKSVPNVNQASTGFSRGLAANTSSSANGSANQPKNFENNQYRL